MISEKGIPIIVGIFIFIGLYLSSLYSYPLFHSLAELFSIAVAFAIFMLIWNSRKYFDNHFLQFIGIAYLFIGMIDLVHTLAYKGLNIFHGYGANLSTQLWIAGRYLQSISLLVAPFFIRRKPGWLVFSAFPVCTALLLTAIFTGIFPVCYIEGVGLTPFKKVSEYIISFILFGSTVVLYRKREHFEKNVLNLMIGSIIATIISEILFTFYINVYGISNLVGHYLKIIAYYLIYRAIVVTGLMKPYDVLFKDLKQREESLRASEVKYRLLFENMIDGFAFHKIIADGNGTPVDYIFLEVNRAFEKLTGLKRQDIIGRRVTEALPGIKHDPTDWIGTYGRVALDGKEIQFEQFAEPLGKWFSVSAYCPIKGYFVAVFEDITERKRAAEALKESETKFTILFNKASVPLVLSKDGVFVDVNEAFARLFGYTKEEAVGKTSLELGINRDSEERTRSFEELQRQGFLRNVELKLFAKTGEMRIVSNNTDVINLGGQRYILSSVIDITERKQAEEKIKEGQRFVQKIADTTPNILYIFDLIEHNLVYVNPMLTQILGYAQEEIQKLGKSLYRELIHPEDLIKIDDGRKLGSLLNSDGVTEIELRIKHANGEWRWINTRNVVFSRTGDGLPKEILGTAQDITGRKKAEEDIKRRIEELNEANEELLRFNRAMEGRELRMIELKKEINELCVRTGQPPRYPLDFEKEKR